VGPFHIPGIRTINEANIRTVNDGPHGDGFSLTEQLTAMPWPMRVILISSDSDPANVAAARRAGAAGFVPKDELSGVELRAFLEQV
jgi:DNA-binding NarL/FixJ family response regulator